MRKIKIAKGKLKKRILGGFCVFLVLLFGFVAGDDPININNSEAVNTCDYETIHWDENVTHYKQEEICYNYTSLSMDAKVCEGAKLNKNGSCDIIVEECYNKTIIDYVELVKKSNEVCKERTKRIEYAESVLEYEKDGMVCRIEKDMIFCDDAIGGDGNGDAVCQSGETCYSFKLTDKIELDEVRNGDKVITSKYEIDKWVKEK
jgi:hypothetical protein